MADPLIAVVGVCAAGKTTLAGALRARGLDVRQVLQEHSYVPSMWQRITKPDLLVYLDASLDTVRNRKNDPEWPEWLYGEQVKRLRHARACCDLYLQTDSLTPAQVLERTLGFLERGNLF